MKTIEQKFGIPVVPITHNGALHSSKRLTNTSRIQSIDLLRGIVMIIMALDHTRDYFHYDAFFYSPTDLSRTSAFLFFTRFITHYCAPVFVFLAGISAYLSGTKKSKPELSLFLLTRGIWLVVVEVVIMSLFRTFNLAFHYLNLQVIWAIGVSMIVLSAMIYMRRRYILAMGFLLVFTHNFLDSIHVNGPMTFLWALLHEQKYFEWGYFSVFVNYPVLPWIGIMALGYSFGSLYESSYDENKRRGILLLTGLACITLFIILRANNTYGDPSHWAHQNNALFSFLSFINVTKYPPSLLYVLITLGPALVFLSLSEMPVNALGQKITVFGRTPMFYYMAHLFLLHLFASIAASITGYPEMVVLSTSVNRVAALKGYGFNLAVVYAVWIGLVCMLYPFCKWFDRYKRANQSKYPWLRYL